MMMTKKDDDDKKDDDKKSDAETVKEYVKANSSNSAFKAVIEQVEAQGMKLELVAEGTNVVYKYTYTVPTLDNAKDVLDESFETQDATFESSAELIRKECDAVKNVVWEYYDMNGKFITSLEK